jgi:hypothetical protein
MSHKNIKLKIVAKGDDWVDWQRPDGMRSRTWRGVDPRFYRMRKLRVGQYYNSRGNYKKLKKKKRKK